jgi:hypothetical protein
LPKNVIPAYNVKLIAIEIEGGGVFRRWVVTVYSLVKTQVLLRYESLMGGLRGASFGMYFILKE